MVGFLILLAIVTAITLIAGQQPGFDEEEILSRHDLTYYPPIWVTATAKAVAIAEGFGLHNAIPTTHNNPGDIVAAGQIIQFASESDGWNALYHQLELIFDNRSKVYSSAMSVREVAEHWTETEKNAWANNVADQLSVSTDTTMDAIRAQYGGG